MTSSQKVYKCFSITQAFLGSPLRFEPALGSQELEDLIDAYVPGPASKQDKLSEVTIEFYKYATVDINTGSLVRTYNVCVAPTPSSWTDATFEQSPTAQSSGFSPSLHTPSPGSSANFTDSGYGTSSFTLTPPARSRNSISTANSRGAIKKSTKKERRSTGLTIETQRIPGFSIMTKDGVDVTTSAGRGTKTKEQREHAHLMRIMKACSECKRKKVRCDPSHRRQDTDMSRTSSASKTSTPPSASLKPSPPASQPILSLQTGQSNTFPLDDTAMNFDMNAINDFVLFPEGDSFWNPADLDMDADFTSQLSLPQIDLDSQDISSGWISNLDLSISDNAYTFTDGQFDLMNTNMGNQSFFSQSTSPQQLDFQQFSGYSSSSPEDYAGYERGVDSGGHRFLSLPSRHSLVENAFELDWRSSGPASSLQQSPVQLSHTSEVESWSEGLDTSANLNHTLSSVSPPANFPYVPSANVNASLEVLGAIQQTLSSDSGVAQDGTYGVCTTGSPTSLSSLSSPDLESRHVRRSRAQRRKRVLSVSTSRSALIPDRNGLAIQGMLLADGVVNSPTPSDSGSASGYESGSSSSSTPTVTAIGTGHERLLQTCGLLVQSYNRVEKPPPQLRALVNDVQLLKARLECSVQAIGQIEAMVIAVNGKLNEILSVISTPIATSDNPGLVDQTHIQVRRLVYLLTNPSPSSTRLRETLVLASGDSSDSNTRVLTSGRNVQLFTPLLERYSQERDPQSAGLLTTKVSRGALGTIQSIDNTVMDLKLATNPSLLRAVAFAAPGDEAIASQLQVYSASPSQYFEPLKKIIQNSTSLHIIEVPAQDALDLQSAEVSANLNSGIRHAENVLSRILTLPDTSSTPSTRGSEDGLISRAPLQRTIDIFTQEQDEPEETSALSATSTGLAACVQQPERRLTDSTPIADSLFTLFSCVFILFTLALVYTTLPLVSSFLPLFTFSALKDGILNESSTATILDVIFKSSITLLLSGASSSSTFGTSLHKMPSTANPKDLFSHPLPQTFINLFDVLSS